jgi:hypothetical protein
MPWRFIPMLKPQLSVLDFVELRGLSDTGTCLPSACDVVTGETHLRNTAYSGRYVEVV